MKTTIVNRWLALFFIFHFSASISAQVTANFAASVTSGCAPLRVEFDNMSTGSIEWDWNFGDGTPLSFDENPVHYYTEPGAYTVSLIAYGAGASDTETKIGYITVTGFGVEVTTTDASCGLANGSVNVTVLGGSLPISYAWNNGATSEDLTGLTAGSYRITITDASGCPFSETYHVENGNLNVSAQIEDASCGNANGSINLTAQSGTPPFTFAWNNGSNDEDRNNLSPGSYRVTVQDASGCTFAETYIVESSGNITISGSVQHVLPGVHNGAIELNITGGTPPYTYSWSNGETGRIMDGLAVGTYCVTVSDANGCSADKCFHIETMQQGGCSTMVVAGSAHDASSATADNGFIELFVTGGTPPYSYLWSNGETGRIIDGLVIGQYCVTVTDANGCTKDKCFFVEAASAGCNLAITGSVDNVSGPGLADGSITLTITGGTSPYTYSWSNGETSKNIDNLSSGQYCVIVTDVNGCTRDKCFIVEVAQGGCGGFSVTQQTTHATCGASNGGINLIVSGGTPPYFYAWSNGSNDQDIFNLAAGNYRVTVEDNGGCRFTETFVISNSNNNIVITATVTNVSASGALDGAINLTVTGGTPPYTYNWTHSATTEDLSGLEVGTYCILVVDANGCAEDKCVNVEGPGCGDFSVTGSETSIGCGGTPGAINVTVQFGTPPYFFQWSNGATTEDLTGLSAGSYTVTVEDSGPCRKVRTFTVGYSGGFQITGTVTPTIAGAATGSILISMSGGTGSYTFSWSNGATSQNIDNLAPGQYCVLVTDANGCIEDKCFTVGITGGCGDFYVTAHDDITVCGAGETFLEANAFFGTQPYSFAWSPSAGLDNPNNRVTVANVTVTTTFTVTATDDNGCTATDEVTVYVVNQSGSVAGVAFDSITICRGDSVQLAAFGGDDYYWDPGNGLSDRNSPTPWTSPEENKNYVVIISNGGCESIFSVHVEVDEDCVWPGDANHDGIANNNDVLAIGIGNGINGFPRPNATNNWEGQFAPDWFLALASGPNLKHVDCDGNGTINVADTLPIFQNYGSTHNRSASPGQKFIDPELYFDLPEDTALAGQEIDVPVFLGTSDIQVSNFYGIAFSVNYDNSIVEENTMRFSPVNSFAGNVGDLLSFDYDMYGESKIDVALTRLNRVSVGGFGQIGTLSFTMKDDISGKDFLVRELALSFGDVRAIDNNENDLLLFYDGGSIVVKQEITGIDNAYNLERSVRVYPNPASDVLTVKLNEGEKVKEISLLDLLGKEIMKSSSGGIETQINLDDLASGTYLLKLKLARGDISKRISIVK